MTIKLDSTRVSVVVICTECPWWRAFAFTKSDGWARGAAHEQATHAGSYQARNARDQAASRSRHAE